LVNIKGPITAGMALPLARRFELTPQFWLNLQNAVDLHAASLSMASRAR